MFYTNENAALHVEPQDGSILSYALRSRCSRAPLQEDIRSLLNIAWPISPANDDLGRRLTQTDPLSNTWQYQYDLNSNLTKIIDPKGQIVDRTWLRGGLLDIQTTSRFVGDPSPHVINYNTGKAVWETFLLAGYTGSAYESYVWQENARMDAVSSVRGIQFARDSGIPVLTITQANLSSVIGQLTSNSNASLNYSTKTVNTITRLVNGGATVTIPRSLIQYEGWTGQVYISAKQSANGRLNASFAIGPFAGGYTVAPPVNTWFNPLQSIATGWDIPTFYRNPLSTAAPPVLSSAINFGSNQYSTIGGDPVNMVTGNMYHTETDLSIKGRGIPIVFERTYNSMVANQSTAVDVPLGYGWTHSFNHFLEFNDDDFNTSTEASDADGFTSSMTWVDGSGARKFIGVTGGVAGVGVGAGFTAPVGFYFQTNRISGGRYTLREKNGTTYTFASVAGTVGQKARLESIADRNGNTLTLTYSGNRLNRVTDDLGRFLQFGYSIGADDRIDSIQDWTGRRYEYAYDVAGDLTTFRNPLAVAGSIQPVTYTYYSSSDCSAQDYCRTFSQIIHNTIQLKPAWFPTLWS